MQLGSQVSSATDYYPFGWEMPGRKYNSSEYRYGFNGKEKNQDGELGSTTTHTTEFRQYNPAIGRFLSLDPVTHYSMSPYSSMDNSPILKSDPNGDDAIIKKRTRRGKTHYKIKYKSVLIDKTGKVSRSDLRSYRKAIKKQLKESFSGSGPNVTFNMKVKLRIGKKPKRGKFRNESTINLVENGMTIKYINYKGDVAEQKFATGSSYSTNTLDAYVNINVFNEEGNERRSKSSLAVTATHEAGHTMGLPHIINESILDSSTGNELSLSRKIGDPFFPQYGLVNSDNLHAGNLMMPGPVAGDLRGAIVTVSQIIHMYTDYKAGKTNSLNIDAENWGTYLTDEHVYRFYYSRFLKSQSLKLQKR